MCYIQMLYFICGLCGCSEKKPDFLVKNINKLKCFFLIYNHFPIMCVFGEPDKAFYVKVRLCNLSLIECFADAPGVPGFRSHGRSWVP